MGKPKYQRVVLKLSGEALAGDEGFGIKPPTIQEIVKEIKEVHELGVEMAIVVGGGNIWRGQIGAQMGMERAQADYMGMLATVMNALALQDTLRTLAYRLASKHRSKCAKSQNLIFAVGQNVI